MKRPTTRHATQPLGASAPASVLMPGADAGEWELCRAVAGTAAFAGVFHGAGNITRQVFATLDTAAANLLPAEPFVFALPVEMGLVQRLTLPAAEGPELEEMARIQLEKILPYPADTVGMATQEISRAESEVVLAVETVHYERLLALCQPLVARGCWPVKVVFCALGLAGKVSAGENTAFVYRESGKYVLGIRENGRLSFAQSLGGQTPEDLAAELPGVLLGAELDGVPTGFTALRFDERGGDGAVLAAALGVPVERFDTGTAALAGAAANGDEGDLSPPQWRTERLRGERRARLLRQLMLGAAIYAGLLLLAFIALGVTKIQNGRLQSRLRSVRPAAAASQANAARWKTLGPAVQWQQFLVEPLHQMEECLPPGDTVRWTAFDQNARGISLQGEAPSASAAVEFTEKLCTRPELKIYHLNAEPPSILPNGRARFRISGNL